MIDRARCGYCNSIAAVDTMATNVSIHCCYRGCPVRPRVDGRSSAEAGQMWDGLNTQVAGMMTRATWHQTPVRN